ncbi:MAG: protein adenylyltransferase SelO family protein, partial [Thiotrichaceae bacterium]
NPYEAFLKAVINRQAALIAQWMQLGFIHGVMNTDNMSIVGETIDYGPCAFMDEFDHQRVYSSIDRQGRYAYSNQPSIGQWNLVRLAETLLPLFIEGEHTNEKAEAAVAMAQDALKAFSTLYEAYWLEGMQRKLGLLMPQDDDRDLIENLLNTMADNQADFTLTFYYLSKLEADQVDVGNKEEQSLRALFTKPQALDSWVVKWRARLEKESAGDQERQTAMQAVNPVYIPRNHQVEAAIRVAEDHNDFSVFYELHDVLQNPYEYQQGREAYMLPPEPEEVVQQTFCGT